MSGLLDISPAPGLIFEWLQQCNQLVAIPGRQSPYLSLCEEEVRILFKTSRLVPSKQQTFEDPLFRQFLRETNVEVPLPEYLHKHSSQNDVAWRKAISNYHRKLPPINIDADWELAEDWLFQTISPLVGKTRVMPRWEALEKTELSRSPGPLHRNIVNTKADFLDTLDSSLHCSSYFQSASEPGGMATLWGCQLKDELRLEEKVLADKTRLFIMAPTEHLVLSNCLSLDFNEKIMEKARNLSGPILVGMPTIASHFNQIAHQLSNFSVVEGMDVNKYDSSIPSEALEMCMRLRFRCMSRQFQSFAHMCQFVNTYRDVIRTWVMLPDGSVVLFYHQPSGTGNTAMDNSLILLFSLFYTWITNGGPRDLSVFRRFVYAKVFGDDSLVGTTEDYLAVIGPDGLRKGMRRLGMEVEFAPALEFLGHFIVWDHALDVYVPVFPYHKVLASLIYHGHHDLLGLISKPFNLRMLSWADSRSWELLDKYCEWLFNKYPAYQEQMASMWKSHEEIKKINCLGSGTRAAQTISLHSALVGPIPDQSPRSHENSDMQRQQSQSGNSNGKFELVVVKPKRPKRRRNKQTQKKTFFPTPAQAARNNSRAATSILNGGGPRTGPLMGNNDVKMRAALRQFAAIKPAIAPKYIDLARTLLLAAPGQWPDGMNKLTSIVTSKIVVPVTLNFQGLADDGRFSFCVNPWIGLPGTDPTKFKIAMVDSTGGWPVDFSLPASYKTTSGGFDLRADPYFSQLTQGQGYSGLVTAAGGAGTSPVGSAPVINTRYGPIPRVTQPGGATNRFFFPAGQWQMNYQGVTSGSTATIPVVTTAGFGNCVIVQDSVVTTLNAANPAQQVVTCTLLMSTDGSVNSYFDFNCGFTTTVVGGGGSGFFYWANMYDPDGDVPVQPNGGPLVAYRPAGMRATMSYTAAQYVGSGINYGLRTPGEMRLQYFQSTMPTAGGFLQNLESLVQVPAAIKQMNITGGSGFYLPDAPNQRDFVAPFDSMNIDYPCIMCSGQFNPVTTSGTLLGNIVCFELEVQSVYECQFNNRMIDATLCVGNSGEVESLIALLGELPSWTENPRHLEIARRFFTELARSGMRLYDWVDQNKATIATIIGGGIKVGAAVGSLL